MADLNTTYVCPACGLNEFELNGTSRLCVECGINVDGASPKYCTSENGFLDNEEFSTPPPSKRPKWNTEPKIAQEPSSIYYSTKKQEHTLVRFNNLISYYNYILHKIVKILRDLGAQQEFEIVCLQLWAAFLQKKKLAFCSKSEQNKTKKNNISESVTQSSADSVPSTWTSSSTDNTLRSVYNMSFSKPLVTKSDSPDETAINQTRTSEANMFQIYAIVAIALNLTGEDIQVCDLMRMIKENQISPMDIAKNFPPNIIKKLTRERRFQSKPSYKYMIEEITKIAKLLNISNFYIPDMKKLLSRYIDDLNLPTDILPCVGRLIKILPPEMKVRTDYMYPAYEARCMAYIIFVMKILFGLDGVKETKISQSAHKVNEEIQKTIENDEKVIAPKLFIWEDWVKYIEMREIIITQHNPFFNTEHKADAFVWWRNIDTKDLIKEKEYSSKIFSNVHNIFDNLCHELGKNDERSLKKPLVFPITLTPARTYLEYVLKNTKTYCENFKFDNFTDSTIKPFYNPKELEEYFKTHQKHLTIKFVTNPKKNCEFVGFYRIDYNTVHIGLKHIVKAKFDITMTEWLKNIKLDKDEDVEFLKKLETYAPKSHPNLKYKAIQNEVRILRQRFRRMGMSLSRPKVSQTSNGNLSSRLDPNEILSKHSFEVFDEDNMDPLDLEFEGPRRHLDNMEIFESLSDNESGEDTLEEEGTILKVSDMIVGTLWGSKSYMKDCDLEVIKKAFPYSFFWLLQTCAQYLDVEWDIVYDQLLVLEACLLYGLDNLKTAKDCLYLIFRHDVKNINHFARICSDIL